ARRAGDRLRHAAGTLRRGPGEGARERRLVRPARHRRRRPDDAGRVPDPAGPGLPFRYPRGNRRSPAARAAIPQPELTDEEASVIGFTWQVVVVTGAGRGLGRLYALEVARRGACVVVNDLGGTVDGKGADRSVADQVVAEIERAGGGAVASHESVASPDGGDAIVRTAVARFGRLDAVVSNAGI